MSSSLQDRPMFDALLDLLPAHRRIEPVGLWDIGEQEAALGELIDVLAQTHTVVGDLTRARIAVLAACARDECEADAVAVAVAVIEHSGHGHDLSAAITRDLAGADRRHGHTAIAWIACRVCDDVLVRIHETMPWGPSLTTNAYAIVRAGPSHPQIHATFESGATALTALTETHHPTS